MKLPAILAAIISVGVIGSGVYFLDATYAREARVCKVEQRLDRKILMDSARDLQRRQWELLRHYGETKGRMLREYRELEHRIKAIRFRCMKKCRSIQLVEKDFRRRVNRVKQQFKQGHDTDNPGK